MLLLERWNLGEGSSLDISLHSSQGNAGLLAVVTSMELRISAGPVTKPYRSEQSAQRGSGRTNRIPADNSLETESNRQT